MLVVWNKTSKCSASLYEYIWHSYYTPFRSFSRQRRWIVSRCQEDQITPDDFLGYLEVWQIDVEDWLPLLGECIWHVRFETPNFVHIYLTVMPWGWMCVCTSFRYFGSGHGLVLLSSDFGLGEDSQSVSPNSTIPLSQWATLSSCVCGRFDMMWLLQSCIESVTLSSQSFSAIPWAL